MLIIGLTGGMGTGKSTLVNLIKNNLRWPIWDADEEVRRLYDDPLIQDLLIATFPMIKSPNGINKEKLREQVQETPETLIALEQIFHPKLAQHRHAFLFKMRRLSQKTILLDIPLLFEKNLENECDLIITTRCSRHLQEQRILERPGMTRELMKSLLSKQMPPEEKCALAHIIVETGLGKRHSWNMFYQQLRTVTRGHP